MRGGCCGEDSVSVRGGCCGDGDSGSASVVVKVTLVLLRSEGRVLW